MQLASINTPPAWMVMLAWATLKWANLSALVSDLRCTHSVYPQHSIDCRLTQCQDCKQLLFHLYLLTIFYLLGDFFLCKMLASFLLLTCFYFRRASANSNLEIISKVSCQICQQPSFSLLFVFFSPCLNTFKVGWALNQNLQIDDDSGSFSWVFCCRFGFCTVAKSCSTLCDPMDCSMPGFPVLHCLLEFAQTHVHWVSDAIQPSHPLSFPSLLAFHLSQLESFPMSQLFSSGGQSFGASASASVLPMNIQCWFPLGLTGLISLLTKGLPRVFSSTTVQKHQSLVVSLLYCPTLTSLQDYWKNYQEVNEA